MPSWEIHKEVCEKLLGFYEREIDEIIDFKLGHDSSRYDAGKLAEAVNIVEKKYGELGLKQLILHHYLDRIHDLVVSHRSGGIKYPRMFDIDEKNIFNLIIHDFNYLEKVTYEVYSKIIHGKSRRSKRRKALGRLKEMHEGLRKHQELIRLKPLILEIVQLIKDNFEFIVNSIERDERVYKRAKHARFLGQVMGKIMTKISYEYRSRTYEKFNQDNSPKKIMDNNANTNEQDFKKILAKKILQLDDLYSSVNDLKSKALILSQMIQLIREIDPTVMEQEVRIDEYRRGKLYNVALDVIGEVCNVVDRGWLSKYEYSRFLSWLDYTRARIFSYLAEKKLVTIDDLEEKKE